MIKLESMAVTITTITKRLGEMVDFSDGNAAAAAKSKS